MNFTICILLTALAVFALGLLLAPVRLRLIMNDHRRTVSLGWLLIQVTHDLKERTYVLYLGSRAIMRKRSKTTEERESKKKKSTEDMESKKSKFKLTDLWRERDFVEKIIRASLSLVWEILRSIRWNKLLLDLDLSTPDPALTGFLYGELCAVKHTTELVFPRAQIEVTPDFINELPKMSAESVLSLRPVRVAIPLAKVFFAIPKIRIIKLIILSKRR
jgi:hypothetical protein